MPNFVRVGPAPPRFRGEFGITPKSGYQPNSAEQAYIDAVKAILDDWAADDAADAAAGYPDRLVSDRQAARAAIAAALDADAGKFIGGQNPTGDLARLTEIRKDYAAAIPKFGTKDRVPPRFEGDFDTVIVSGYVPGSDEQAFLDCVEAAKSEFATDKGNDVAGGFSPAVIKSREAQRKKTAEELRSLIEDSPTIRQSAKAAVERVVLRRGRYHALRDRLARRLFNVSLKSEPKKPADDDNSDLILDINLLGGLPPPQDMPSADKLELYVQINKALTVVRTVCERIDDSSARGLRAWIFGPNKDLQKRARLLQAEFLEKLHGAAWIGLELEFTAMAKLTLAEVRNEFFVREAGRIKNMYVRRLGAWAGVTALLLILSYIELYIGSLPWSWGYDHKSFLLAAGGAAIGAWASFSVRQVQFSFDDLVMVEESSLDPPMRVLFVIVLTMATCLLFWNGAINLEIGNLKTQAEPFRQSGSIALLIGLFCGLSERALATAIAGRASAFVKGVAGAA
jgi:hypothetical protein